MEGFVQENELLLRLKNIYQNYKTIVWVAFISVLFCMGVLAYAHHHRSIKNVQASIIYQQMLEAYYKPDEKSLDTKGQELLKDFKTTTYYQAAALLLAKQAAQKNQTEDVNKYLRLAVDAKKSADLVSDIAKVRLAHVLREKGDLDGALKLLEHYDDSFQAIYQEAIGDVYVAKGDISKAKNAYKLALESLPFGTQAPLLQMKLIDLGIGDENAS